MRFREVREIREIKNDSQKVNNYKKIKPESSMTVEEACSYWDSLFDNLPEEIVDPDGVNDLPNEILF